MIKANQVRQDEVREPVDESRIDALARAMGYVYRNGDYVLNNVVAARRVQTTEPVRRSFRTKTSADGSRHYRHPHLSKEMYGLMRNMAVRDEIDVTSYVRQARLSNVEFAHRLSSWQWNENERHGGGRRYDWESVGGRIIVNRVA